MRIEETFSQIGGGALPRSKIKSVALVFRSKRISADEIAMRLRHEPAIIGYIAKSSFVLDVRTILPSQDQIVVQRSLAHHITGPRSPPQNGFVAPRSLTEKHFIVATAGHVDHGKSALVKALTGVDPDRLLEERARGITIELGFVHLELASPNESEVFSIGVIDVPGHEDFVKKMVGGQARLILRCSPSPRTTAGCRKPRNTCRSCSILVCRRSSSR